MRSPIPYEHDPKIEGTFCLRRKKQRLKKHKHQACETSPKMASGEGDQRRTSAFYYPGFQGITLGIDHSNVEAHHCELKPTLISMV